MPFLLLTSRGLSSSRVLARIYQSLKKSFLGDCEVFPTYSYLSFFFAFSYFFARGPTLSHSCLFENFNVYLADICSATHEYLSHDCPFVNTVFYNILLFRYLCFILHCV